MEVPAPTAATPSDPGLLRAWATGYVRTYGWAVAPVWLNGGPACRCPKGMDCETPGKHLVSGLGVARDEEDVEHVWPADRDDIGLAVLCGSESRLVVLDVKRDVSLVKARLGLSGHVLTQTTPSGGQHWFFQLPEDIEIIGGRSQVELVNDVTVLGAGGFVVLYPRPGYTWVGGSDTINRGAGGLPDTLKLALTRLGLLDVTLTAGRDDIWRCPPGRMLAGGDPRTYSRTGDLRRIVDRWGDDITWTPTLGYQVWTESGWQGGERAHAELQTLVAALPEVHLTEAEYLHKAGKDTVKKEAMKWGSKARHRASASLLGDLSSDRRIWVPDEKLWDSSDEHIGLPVVDGVGRVVDLTTSTMLPESQDQKRLRISRRVGAAWQGEDWATMRERATYFPQYLRDIEEANGPELVRLLQRAAGASLYGRRTQNSAAVDSIFVLLGPGRSGKSTFVEALLAAAGDYARTLSPNLLFGSVGNPEYSIADIYGARMLVTSEPTESENRPVNITMLKAVTGGDTLSGRMPYGKAYLRFRSEAVLWVAANHQLQVDDDALWERIKTFRFDGLDFTGGKGNPLMRSMLRSDPLELRAELAWVLDGARLFAEEGWGDTALWDEERDVERTTHDPLARFIGTVVTVTGRTADTFTEGALLTSFDYWRTSSGAEGVHGAVRKYADELGHRIVRAGLSFDRGTRTFSGGVLT